MILRPKIKKGLGIRTFHKYISKMKQIGLTVTEILLCTQMSLQNGRHSIVPHPYGRGTIIREIHTHQAGHWWWITLECLLWTWVQHGMANCQMEIWPFLSSRGIVTLSRFIFWGYHFRVPTVFTVTGCLWSRYPGDRWLSVWELYFRNHPESACRTGHIRFVGFTIDH